MDSSSESRKAFLDAALYGDTLSFHRFVAEAALRFGHGPGKIVCAAQKTPEGSNALHLAALGGKTLICRRLVEDLDFDINGTNHEGETPLFLAARRGHLPTVKYLIQNGADVSRSNSKGSTPLYYAAGKPLLKSKEIVALLISKGADIHAVSERGMPLHAAAIGGNDVVLKYLLDLGADPNSISPLFTYPLMLAMIGESVECMELLLKAGADPNEDCSGSQMSPLCFAVIQQYDKEMIRCLLNAGADPNRKSHCGMTPLEHASLTAAATGRLEAVQLLFPVTSCIPCYPDWSINGIMKHIVSRGELLDEGINKMEETILNAKARAKKSFERKDYVDAKFWYTQAIMGDPSDAKALSNRSLCCALLNDGRAALEDAQACVRLEPGWAKAHYREGAAWTVLKDYEKAVEAFARALALEPGNKEIESAYRETLVERFKALGLATSNNS